MTSEEKIHHLIVIGGGPAAYTAALYAARADLAPLVIEGFEAGGQLMITTDVDNYPGFRDGILGPALVDEMRSQAERFGATYLTDDVTDVEFSDDPVATPHVVRVGGTEHRTRAVIVATGATARQIGLPSERALQGKGVSYCAVCDAAFVRGKRVAVVGGGDSAMEEATFLAKFATEVVIVHRRPEFRASRIMLHRAEATSNVRFEVPYGVERVLESEDGNVGGLLLRNTETDEAREIEVDGLFVAIGHDPTTALFVGKLDMDEAGYLIQKPGTTYSNVPGVFVAGDVADHVYRQAITAAGSGCEAALDAEWYLRDTPGVPVPEGMPLGDPAEEQYAPAAD
jgi:thioredoxin reductase (NADPH)